MPFHYPGYVAYLQELGRQGLSPEASGLVPRLGPLVELNSQAAQMADYLREATPDRIAAAQTFVANLGNLADTLHAGYLVANRIVTDLLDALELAKAEAGLVEPEPEEPEEDEDDEEVGGPTGPAAEEVVESSPEEVLDRAAAEVAATAVKLEEALTPAADKPAEAPAPTTSQANRRRPNR